MFKYCFAFLFLCSFSWAQEILLTEESRYWKFHNFAGVGYRYDRQSFQEFVGNASAQNSNLSIHGRSSPFLILGNHTEFKDVLLIVRGAYGWLGYGQIDYALPGNYGGGPLSFSQFKDGSGYSAEGQASLSYIFSLNNQTNFSFALIPGVGYHYFHLMDYPSGIQTSPIPLNSASLGTNGYAQANFIRPLQQDWFGPFFEGRLLFRFEQKVQVEVFYQYHLPDMRLVNCNQISTYLFNPSGTVTEIQQQQYHNVVHGRSLRTQLGGIDFRLHGKDAFTFGLHFEGAVTWSDSNRYYVQEKRESYLTNPGSTRFSTRDRMAIDWVNYMTYMSAGYRF